VSWSGCASGTGNQAICPVTSLQTITATATAIGPGGDRPSVGERERNQRRAGGYLPG
jgi:hypothetical protein